MQPNFLLLSKIKNQRRNGFGPDLVNVRDAL